MTEQEELQMLRALTQKQKEELVAKERIIEEQSIRIEKQNIQIEKQNVQIENMIQALLHARKKLFGSSTETTKQIEGQLSLFEDMQQLAKQLGVEQKKITVKPYERVPRQPGVRAELLAALPKEVEEYILPPEETCSACGSPLTIVGRQIVRTEVEYQPAKLIVKQIVQQVAKCSVCGEKGSNEPNSRFYKAAVPVPPLSHSICTPSLLAQVMYQKFAMGLPLARQEKDWYRLGLVLPRKNMAYWIIRCSEEWLEPIYWRIHERLKECEVLHMDETRIQCNKEKGKKASSESFMWVMRSAACEQRQGAFFYYSSTRSGEIAKQLLAGFHGYLITDAYSGYDKLTDVKHAFCWSHYPRSIVIQGEVMQTA